MVFTKNTTILNFPELVEYTNVENENNILIGEIKSQVDYNYDKIDMNDIMEKLKIGIEEVLNNLIDKQILNYGKKYKHLKKKFSLLNIVSKETSNKYGGVSVVKTPIDLKISVVCESELYIKDNKITYFVKVYKNKK